MKRAAAYIAAHRKWITGMLLTGAASIAGYAWPDKPWLVTIIGMAAVGLGVNITPNREAPQLLPAAPAGPPQRTQR
jgi:hypothetical protein